MAHPRIVPLEGGCNFRDFGGYRTEDGRRVRWGVLYRSGVLNRLSPKGVTGLHDLGVRTVCDLRRNDERMRHPNPVFGSEVDTHAWDTTTEISPIREQAFATAATLDAARAAMIDMYRRMPFRMKERLNGTLAALLEGGLGGFVVHCSAGKDRTGTAVALILSMLGVPRAQIIEDYVLTNTTVDLAAQLLRPATANGVGLAATAAPILALTPAARSAVLDAHPSYLLSMFETLDEKCGSTEEYLRVELGLNPVSIDRARERLLVSGDSGSATSSDGDDAASNRGAA